MSPDDLMFESAVALGRHIQAGEISSVELTEAYLARIERLNPKLEAFVTVTAERALAEADQADAEIAAGQPRSPLHGVPYCLKDIIQTEGIRTTVGSLILADWVPEHDATIVTRLGEAGAVLLGKANTHEFAFGATTQNVHGRTRNPWDLSRIPGGSSGGSAAAVAAGLAGFTIGSDTAGSVRLPAAFCGIAGLKPTFGLVSAAGVVAQSYTSDHVGPLARTVEDLAAIMALTAGPDPADPTCLADAPPGFATGPASLEGVRIGIPVELMALPLEPAVAQGFAAAQDTLSALGAEVREVSVPLLARATAINNAIVPPETSAQHLHWGETWFRGRTIRYGEDVAGLLAMGRDVPATAFILASRERRLLGAELAALFEGKVDLLLTPTQAVTATRPDQATVELEGEAHGLLDVLIHFLCGFSLTGVPALAVPAGFSAEGLPVSIQLIGPQLADSRVLQAGMAFERATGLARHHPPLPD